MTKPIIESDTEFLKREMTRLLSHIAPGVLPEKNLSDLFWQIDNACCGMMRKINDISLLAHCGGVLTRGNLLYINSLICKLTLREQENMPHRSMEEMCRDVRGAEERANREKTQH